MLQKKIIDKINNIFGIVDVYFNADDLTQTNKLAVVVENIDYFLITNGANVEQYFISADFTFIIDHNNSWSIDVVLNRLAEYNLKKKDKVNIIPRPINSDIVLTLEFYVDIAEARKDVVIYPMKEAEIEVTI